MTWLQEKARDMPDNLGLEDFLNHQSQAGEQDSEGVITLAPNEALRKISQFQLPEKGSWALKLVQAAIAGELATKILVQQGRDKQSFQFLYPKLSLSRLEKLFYDPAPTPSVALNHLRSALWGVGLRDGRSFVLALPAQTEALVWNGVEFSRQALEKAPRSLILSIRHRRSDEKWGLLSGHRQAAARNAEVSDILARQAFTCPIPLSIDQRRIDALQYCPTHGCGQFSHPFALGGVDAETPGLRIPPGSFEQLAKGTGLRDRHLRELAAQAQAQALLPGRVSVAYMLSLHIGQERQGKVTRWKTYPKHSRLYWVTHGVMVQSENLLLPPLNVSLAAFVSADGLKTDLTTMKLQQTPQRFERFQNATLALTAELQKHREVSLEGMVIEHARAAKVEGGLLLFLGVITLPALPVSALMLWAGYDTCKTAGQEVEGVVEEGVADLKRLQAEWEDRYGRGGSIQIGRNDSRVGTGPPQDDVEGAG